MSNNKLIIAAAGSGKTTFLVKEALSKPNENILITTYTDVNAEEIKKKIISCNKFIPKNITVQPWFTFLIQHGVKPYQGHLTDKKITGLLLVSGTSPAFIKKSDVEKFYFTPNFKIYSDKLSLFILKCNEESNGLVINRISRIFKYIYIDEIQDLAGNDLELLKLFLKSKSTMLLVGDPRQGTYSTNNSRKNKKYRKSEIIHFFEDNTIDIETDDTSLVVNHRCPQAICDLSNKLFPDLIATASGNNNLKAHTGVFFIKKSDVNYYLKKYNPIQLRENKAVITNSNYEAINFGESKGLTFERVLIYPTKPFTDWILGKNLDLKPTSRSKLYVALTRAKVSVGIIYDYNEHTKINDISNFSVNADSLHQSAE